jgi:hypothetical protein
MNTRSYRGKAAVFVAATLVTLAAAKVSLARQNSSPVTDFDGSNAQASRLGLVSWFSVKWRVAGFR